MRKRLKRFPELFVEKMDDIQIYFAFVYFVHLFVNFCSPWKKFKIIFFLVGIKKKLKILAKILKFS